MGCRCMLSVERDSYLSYIQWCCNTESMVLSICHLGCHFGYGSKWIYNVAFEMINQILAESGISRTRQMHIYTHIRRISHILYWQESIMDAYLIHDKIIDKESNNKNW